jgi:hypothetical protein
MNEVAALQGHSTFMGKAKAVWKTERLKELLTSLRGHQTAVNTIINLLQVYVIPCYEFLLESILIVAGIPLERSRIYSKATRKSS